MVEHIGIDVPKEFSLSQNYPNPFNPTTVIPFGLPKEGFVTLKIFDIGGKEIETLLSQEMSAGYYRITWGAHVPSGVVLVTACRAMDLWRQRKWCFCIESANRRTPKDTPQSGRPPLNVNT